MYRKLLFFFFIPFMGLSQAQIGNDIEGIDSGDNNGFKVSLSSDGKIIAVGANQSQNPNKPGYVRVYSNILGNWIQLGQSIYGENMNDQNGYSVSLSDDGSVLAIGALYKNNTFSGYVRIFKYVSGLWQQIGQNINVQTNTLSGTSISLSSNGDIVAIGSPGSNLTRIYSNILGGWVQIGNDIFGEGMNDENGYSIDISSDGSIVAIGARFNIQNGSSGHVRVFQNILGVWTQMGMDIDGENGDFSGASLSLSGDGNTVAIGAPTNGTGSGKVRVYKNLSGAWVKIGNDIEGLKNSNDSFGNSVSISNDGNIVAASSIYGKRQNGQSLGYVQVYRNISGSWVLLADIEGKYFGERCGEWISLSSDASVLAIGSPHAPSNIFKGHARIYDLSSLLKTESFVLENFNIYPNPTSDVLNISLENDLILQEVIIYNSLGQIVKKSNKTKIDVSSLSKGMFHVEVKTDEGKASKKIIIK